jgi:RHS repeat-associated protein
LVDTRNASNVVLLDFNYDDNGNRIEKIDGSNTYTYAYDSENRLRQVTKGSNNWYFDYDYRTRRIKRQKNSGTATTFIFSGGTSLQEIESGSITLEYVRGSDWGGGVGGVLYTLEGGGKHFFYYNPRGDVVAKTGWSMNRDFIARYEAFGTRVQEEGNQGGRQYANTKDEETELDLLNEGFRWRDLITGVFMTKDPMGFVDGPNVYAYVVQNPWTKFDPEGLSEMSVSPITAIPMAIWNAGQQGAALAQRQMSDGVNPVMATAQGLAYGTGMLTGASTLFEAAVGENLVTGL